MLEERDNKIAIVSAYNFNYGTILQATALINVLQQNGNCVEVINYKKNISLMQIKRVLNRSLVKAKFLKFIKDISIQSDEKSKEWNLIKNIRFDDFLNEHIPFSEKIVGYNNLKEKIINYSKVLLGSDQLWNPINLGTHYFTLEFVPDYIPKYTYATSFGVSELKKNEEKIMAKILEKINYISVREQQGAMIVAKLVPDKNVRVDLDPTLLLDSYEWDRIIPRKRLKEGRYILAYFVGASVAYRKMADKFAEKYNCNIVLLPHIDQYVKSERKYESKLSMAAGPQEFVNLIRYADYIFTDSFHGCVFSIIYKKQFFTFPRFKKTDFRSMNSRIESLFSILDVPERWVRTFEDIECMRKININYEIVNKTIDECRFKSLAYLKELF